MDDTQIVALYLARDESAIEQTKRKYDGYCRYIAERILPSREDAEECVNDAYLKAWNTIPPQQPQTLSSYIGMLTRQLSLNRYKENHRQKRGGGEVALLLDELAECIADRSAGNVADDVMLRDALDRFLGGLKQRDRIVFMRRYWYADTPEHIAKELSMTEQSVNVLLFRTRKKLKQFLEKEGIYL